MGIVVVFEKTYSDGKVAWKFYPEDNNDFDKLRNIIQRFKKKTQPSVIYEREFENKKISITELWDNDKQRPYMKIISNEDLTEDWLNKFVIVLKEIHEEMKEKVRLVFEIWLFLFLKIFK